MADKMQKTELKPETLRWHCDPGSLKFATTADVDPLSSTVGQPFAQEALRFGLECTARGQNVYVRGLTGTGRLSTVRRLLSEIDPAARPKQDRCYVHNFSQPERPRLISLPGGQARRFRRRLKELSDYIVKDLAKALEAEPYKSERETIQQRMQTEVQGITAPVEEDLRAAGMATVSIASGPVPQTAIFPLVDDEPVPPDQFDKLIAEGTVPAERKEQYESQLPEFQDRVQSVTRHVGELYQAASEEVHTVNEKATRQLLGQLADGINKTFPSESVSAFVNEIIDDVVENRLQPAEHVIDPAVAYGVNVLLEDEGDTHCPVVEDNTASLVNLLGAVEPEFGPNGPAHADYRGIRAGSLLRADGGYLILDVKDVLSEPGAWKALMRTLRTGHLEIVPADVGWMHPYLVLKPEPIEISVRVILIGDAGTYYQLNYLDPDFSEMFKVLADFDNELDRNDDGIDQYASVLSQIARDESLLHFDAAAVAALAEHGARIASRDGKLTARFGRIADLAREASFLAAKANAALVGEEQVESAIQRTKQRASLPSRKFQQMVNSGTIQVETSGAVVGQINGLAVISSGPLTYGFPARITATIGAGRAGLINIEGHASLSGSIHTKGFHILGGLLRHLLRTEHPLAFSASIAFEQSYGGIDGDSASGAEICCLLSALTSVPIKQSFAMTGAIDQLGHLQAIGGVNEKIEGFFDSCEYFGLTGQQGVIIPQSNAGDLMLRNDVVAACERGEFRVHAVTHIHQALAIMTGMRAGEFGDNGYPEGTLLHLAVERAADFWRRTLQSPAQLVTGIEGTDETDPLMPQAESDED